MQIWIYKVVGVLNSMLFGYNELIDSDNEDDNYDKLNSF